MADITNGYNAIQSGNQDENYIGQDEIKRMLQQDREIAKMQAYRQIYAEMMEKEKAPLSIKPSKYSKYISSVEDTYRQDEIKAQKQSILDKAVNGTFQFAVNTLATVLDNTLGTAAGIASAGYQGAKYLAGDREKPSIGDALIDGFINNPITAGMQGLRDLSKEVAPIYRTEQLGNRSVGEMLTDPNFWFDDMLVNAGFTVGSMLSMYNGAYGTLKNPNGFFSTAKYVATNPMRSAQAFSNKIKNKTTFGKELTRIERSRKYKQLGKINSLINDVEKQTGFKPVRTGAYVNYNTTRGKLWNAWKASSGEARMEAYNAYSDFITDQNDALEERYNKDYDSIINSDQSEDQKKQQIKKLDEKYNRARSSLQGNASKLAAAVFAQNKLILTLSNVVDQQFFIRPIVKNKPNLTIRTESKINALKKTGVRSVNGVEEKVSINELAKEGNLTAKSLKECKILQKQEIDQLGGEKALNELLEKATEQSVKTGKNVSEILDGYINTAAVIDGVFRDVSTREIVEGAQNAINVERKLITNNNKLTKTIDYMFGNAKTKRQAIIQGLVIKPTQEGWEELSQAWAEENAKSFYSSELESIMNDKKNDRSALNLFDPAGIVGLITSIFTAPLSNSKGPFATTDSWNTVWKDRWNEGFMGSMTGLLGTINPAGMYTKRKMKKAAKKRYDIIAERNKSLKEALKLSDEDFKEIFADQALAEENARKQYEDWSKLKISRDVWANELFNALDEADEYKKNIQQSVDNAQKYYADTTAVKARIRKIAESLSAARKSEFEDIDHQLAVTAAQEALLAQISEAYDLGISSDFIQKIKEVYKDIEKTDEDRDKDEAEIIREHLKNIGFIEDDNDNDNSTEDNRKRTVFDDIMLDSREHKIDRANEILKAIRDNILEKAVKYENLRQNLDDEKYNSLSNENKDQLAKAYVMYDDAQKNLVDILNSDISGEIGLSLINFVNKTIESDATGEKRAVYYIDNNGKINKATVGKNDEIIIEGGEVKIEKGNGETEVVVGNEVKNQEFIDELLNNNFAEKITKKIGRIRSLGQRAAFLFKQKEELNKKEATTDEEQKLRDKLNDAYSDVIKEYHSLINSLQRPYLGEGIYGHHGQFSRNDYVGYFKFQQIKQKEENRGKSNRELLKILDKENKNKHFNLDHIAQMIDRNLVQEFEDVNGTMTQTRTSNERFIPVNDRSLYTTEGVISTEGESDIVANKKIVGNQQNMMETFIKSFLKATSLHQAISAALDNIDKFKEKSDQYRQKYDDMMEDHKVDEFFRWIDSDNLFEVYDMLDNIDTMCSDVVIEGDEAVVRSNLNKEQLIAIRQSVLERLERNNPELLKRVLQLDFAMDVVRKAAVKINDTDYIVVKRKEKDNDGKEVDVLEKISLNELEESIRKDFSGKSNEDLLSINFNEIIKDKIEKLEGSKYDDANKTKEDKEKEAEKTQNAIDKLSELVNVTSNLVINRGEGNNRRGGHLSLNRRIYETDDMKEVGKALLITENSEGGPIDNSGKEDKKEKDEDEGKEKEQGNVNEPEANEGKNETEDGKEENNEPEASQQGEGENNNEGNNENNNEDNNEIEDNIKGDEEEELKNQNNEPKEKRKAKEDEEKEEENTEDNNEVNDKEYSEGKPNPSQEGSVRSYRCPAFEHSKTVKEDGVEKLDQGLEHKVLKENNDTNARVARLIYQDFIDGGYLRRIIERKEKSDDQGKKESARDLVLMKIHFDEKNSGGNSAISQKIYNFIYKDLDDSRKKDEAIKINSIIWLAIELDDYTPEKYKNFNNCVEYKGKRYALVGMYDDPQNVDAINEKFRDQENENEVKVLEAESEDGKSGIVTTSITKMYSGRIANKTSDGKRQRLRRIDENTFKDILVYTHVNKGFVAFGDQLNLSENYETNDEQNRIDSILDENRGDGAYYALIKANDGRYYRIALRVARYNKDFVGVEEGIVQDKLIEKSENELNINSKVASINAITQEMAKNIVQFLKGERKGSVQELITDGRKKMLNYLCQIKVPVSGEEGKFDYDRLEIKLNGNGNIELYFSYNKDENGEVGDDKKIVFTEDYIKELIKEKGMSDSQVNNEIAERIRELYMKENFRFRLPLKAAVGGTERNVTTEELIKTELLYIDLAGKKLPDGQINIFNDSSFEVAQVTIDEHNIVKVGDRTFNVNKVKGVGKRRPMFAGLGIERKEDKGRVQVELDMGGNETLIARFEDGNEENVPTIYLRGNEENMNDNTNANWTKIDKNDSRYYLGIAAYSYMTDYGNVNQFRANVWYPLTDSTNKVFAFIKTDGEGKVVKYVEYDDNIKAAIKIDEETLHSIQRRFRPIEPGTLSDMLDIYAQKNNKNSTVKWTNMAMGILTDTIEKTYEEIRKRDSITDQEAKNIVQAAYDSAKDDAKGFNLEEEKLKSMEDDEQEQYESVKQKLEDTIQLFKNLSDRKLNSENEIKGISLKGIISKLQGKTTKYDKEGIEKMLKGKTYKDLLNIAFEIAYDIEIADDQGCKS